MSEMFSRVYPDRNGQRFPDGGGGYDAGSWASGDQGHPVQRRTDILHPVTYTHTLSNCIIRHEQTFVPEKKRSGNMEKRKCGKD